MSGVLNGQPAAGDAAARNGTRAEFALREMPALLAGREIACQACGSADLTSFFGDNGVPAIRGDFLFATCEDALECPRGDLELALCRSCGTVSNLRFDERRILQQPFGERMHSQRLVRFMIDTCDDQITKYGLGTGSTVLEIGCGSGEFLTLLCERAGCDGIGVDPAHANGNVPLPSSNAVRFVQDAYGPACSHLRADYVYSRRAIEELAGVSGFARELRETLGERRHVHLLFQLRDVESVLEHGAFWDLSFQQCTYFTRGSAAALLRRNRFHVVELYRAYGGQFVMIEARPAREPTLARLSQEDDLQRMTALASDFAARVRTRTRQIEQLMEGACAEGADLCIWGAGPKCAALLHGLRAAAKRISVVDVDPARQGRFLAGSGIEVAAPETLARKRRGIVLLPNAICMEEVQGQLARVGCTMRLVPL